MTTYFVAVDGLMGTLTHWSNTWFYWMYKLENYVKSDVLFLLGTAAFDILLKVYYFAYCMHLENNRCDLSTAFIYNRPTKFEKTVSIQTWTDSITESPSYLGSWINTNHGLLYGFAFWIICTPEIILTCTFFLLWPNTNHFTNSVWSEVILLELS